MTENSAPAHRGDIRADALASSPDARLMADIEGSRRAVAAYNRGADELRRPTRSPVSVNSEEPAAPTTGTQDSLKVGPEADTPAYPADPRSDRLCAPSTIVSTAPGAESDHRGGTRWRSCVDDRGAAPTNWLHLEHQLV